MIKRYFTIFSAIALLAVAVPTVPVWAGEMGGTGSEVTTPTNGEEKQVHTVTFVISFGGQSASFSVDVEDGESASVPGDIASEIMDEEGNIYVLSAWKDAAGNAVDLGNVTSDMTVYAQYVNQGSGSNDDDPAEKEENKKKSSDDSKDSEESSSNAPASSTPGTAAPTTVAAAKSVPAVTPNTAVKTAANGVKKVASAPAGEAAVAGPADTDVIVGIDPEAEVGGPVSREPAAMAAPEEGAIAGPAAPETTEIVDGPVALAGSTGSVAFPWWIIMAATALAMVFGGFRYVQFRKNEQ